MAITLNGTTGVTTTGLTSNGIDDNATSTAMTLDTSGNLLVGKTSSSINTQGVDLRADGQNYFVRNNGTPIFVNRQTSDGTLLDLRKDGTTVGSIGVINSNNLTINGTASNHTGLQFGTSIIWPMRDSANADGTVDLGTTSGRFKDLYLSGGVYLGGVGAANKLDDYEEGTWTPSADFATTSPSGGATTGTGAYTKVGNSVTVWGSCTNINVTGSAGSIKITGLPFAAKANALLALYAGTVRMSAVNIANSYCVAEIRDGESRILIMEMIDNANATNLTTADFTHGQSDMFFTVNYQTA